nr:unnamed protein product [Callosobruchus analis]
MSSRKLFQYTENAMQNALDAVRLQSMPISTACKKFNVPRTSVRNRLDGKTKDGCRRVGPECDVGPEIEQKLVAWILDCSSRGFPINKEGLLYSVQKILEECDINTKLLKGTPGRKWFESFMKRHPEVSHKKAEFINKARAAVSEESIRRWFNHTKELLGTDAGSLVLGPKGKNIYDVGTSDKDNVTTLIAVNAAGLIAPPLTIYKFKRLPKTYATAAPEGWGVGTSDSRWMQSKQFYEYFANVFIKFLDYQAILRPVIVFVDGHSSHLSLNLSNLCRENGIILICLPPNTTHLLQPHDVAFFYPLKQAWKNITRKWLYEHEGQNIHKKDIPFALNSILKERDFTSAIKSGFRICGLYPFNENAPNYNKCVSKGLIFNEELRNPNMDEKKSHFKFVEEQMDPWILQSFKTTYANQYYWRGEDRYLELYNFWRSIKVDVDPEPELNTSQEMQTDTTQELETTSNFETFGATEIQTKSIWSNVNIQDNILLFDFPEFNNTEEIVDASEETISRTVNNERINVLQNIVISEVSEKSDNINGNSNNNNNNVRLLKKRTVSGVLQDVKTWPEEYTGKSQRKRNPLPSVVTSDKWIEIFEAKEKFKENSAAEKAVKKNKRIDKINKRNKSIKRNVTEKTNNGNNHVKEETTADKSDVKWFETNKENRESDGRVQHSGQDLYENTVEKEKIKNTKTCEESMSTLLNVGSYVIVKYEGELYPAKILNKERNEWYCCAMRKSRVNNWKWPDSPDLLWYKNEDLILQINEPKEINNRRICVVPEIESLL